LNPKIIILCAIISIVAIALILDIDYVGNIETAITNLPEINKIPVPMLYDCAKNFDELSGEFQQKLDRVESQSNYISNYKQGMSLVLPLMIEVQERSDDLMQNRCWITVESWAHESDNEMLIWSMPWEYLSYSNQLILGEIEPTTDADWNLIKTYKNNLKDLEKMKQQLKELKN